MGKIDEPQKKRKLSYINSSASVKFSTTITPVAKQFEPPSLKLMEAPFPKLMEASMKAINVEMVWRANEEDRASEDMKNVAVARTPKKIGIFLARQDEKIAPAVMDMLPPEVRGPIANFGLIGGSLMFLLATRWI